MFLPETGKETDEERKYGKPVRTGKWEVWSGRRRWFQRWRVGMMEERRKKWDRFSASQRSGSAD